MTADEALRRATARLAVAGIDGAGRDARVLLAHAMGIGADRLSLHLCDVLVPEAEAAFDRAVAARTTRQPVSQIVGGRLFWGRWFGVTGDVLDPRPETETLIAAALETRFRRVLDLGTGSGAILLTLLAECPEASGLGVDLSVAALEVARSNSAVLGLEARADFADSNWFSGVTGRFDLIVANPPYLAETEMAGLSPEVRLWEPHLALTPGGDGLDAYRAIAAGLALHLEPGARVFLEIGPTQGPAVAGLLRDAGLVEVGVIVDLDGRERVVAGRA